MSFILSLIARFSALLSRASNKRFTGTGKHGVLSERRNIQIPPYIEVGSAIKLVVQKGVETHLHVSVRDPEHLSRVSTTVTGGVLVIEFISETRWLRGQMNVFENAEVTVGICLPHLRRLHANGSASAILNDVSGDMLEVEACDAASVDANGVVKNLTVIARDAATIDALALCAADVRADVDDAGEVRVSAKNAIYASGGPAGRILVAGDPSIRHIEKSVTRSMEFIGT